MNLPRREKVAICTPDTYKYFFAEEEVFQIWELLEGHYGPVRTTSYAIEIDSEAFRFRSTHDGNPILAIRRRKCTAQDVERFHALIHFEPESYTP